ncbi:MAG: Crp/Fnr family transcriptional regulator [Bacteroidetes bacterium]|jgi:CRP-like cAMP-binding protein|nr:Crp/Fnr family transcriptional regulator [Bacteroidota bacterium]MCA6444301.1 Crp/Fnr family transcriptional regulator [Bacteroidota bacterium]
MKVSLENIIQQILPLPQDVLKEVVLEFQHLEYPKNYFLLKPGKICQHLWFMTNGAVRSFYTNEQGKELNTWFSLDAQIITDTTSFVKQEPALESIQLLEDSELYAIERSSIVNLLQKHHIFTLWYIKLVEVHYIPQTEDRMADLQFLDAKQRYNKLLDLYPCITNRISLGHISSYLNITPETLSRIRAGKL